MRYLLELAAAAHAARAKVGREQAGAEYAYLVPTGDAERAEKAFAEQFREEVQTVIKDMLKGCVHRDATCTCHEFCGLGDDL